MRWKRYLQEAAHESRLGMHCLSVCRSACRLLGRLDIWTAVDSKEDEAMISKTLLDAEDLGLCPCGRRIYADLTRTGVIHEMPMCVPFQELEAEEFLRYVRLARDSRRGQD